MWQIPLLNLLLRRSSCEVEIVPETRPLEPKPRAPKSRATTKTDPHLGIIWSQLQREFFPGRTDISDYAVAWSTRSHRRTLATCNLHRRLVTVARELLPAQYHRVLPPLLYHEMCHAIIGKDVAQTKRGRAWHGKQFRDLERRHPEIKWLNEWIKSGGWSTAIRSDRSKRAWARRRG